MFHKECANDTEQGCSDGIGGGLGKLDDDEWLEETVWNGLRMWHVIFLSAATVLSVIILLCCCVKFRIPRTKQEIEGDYIRRKIMRKFRKRLKAIQNQELDEMDLKKALDKIRTELKSDTESLQQSDVLSGATLSSAAGIHAGPGSTYRRASQIQIDISLEDLRIQSLGLGARIALAVSRFFHRNPKRTSPGDVAGGGENASTPEVDNDKPTTALLSPSTGASKKKEGSTSSGKKEKDSSSAVDKAKVSSKSEKSATPKTEAVNEGKAGKKAATKDKSISGGSSAAVTQVTTEKETKSTKEKVKEAKKSKSSEKGSTSKDTPSTTKSKP